MVAVIDPDVEMCSLQRRAFKPHELRLPIFD